MSYIIGVDIGGTTMKSGLFEAEDPKAPLYTWSIPTDTEDGGARILTDAAEACLRELARIQVPIGEIQAAGIGVPGPVTGGAVVHGCPNLGWGTVDVSRDFASLTGIPRVETQNDANCAALGELLYGAGQGADSCAMVVLGTGVGCGVVLDGKILTGRFGAAGEIGHLPMKTDETAYCGCGKKGCLEQYASATGLVREARQRLDSRLDLRAGGPSVLRSIPLFTAKDVMDAARSGDPLALSAVRTGAEMLGRGLAMVACTADPGLFILGGGLAQGGSFYLDLVRASYRAHCYPPSQEAEFRLAALGPQAGLIGAAALQRTRPASEPPSL